MTRSTSTDRRLVKDGAVPVRLGEVVDDRGVNEAGRDAGEAEVVRDGSMSVAVVRDGNRVVGDRVVDAATAKSGTSWLPSCR